MKLIALATLIIATTSSCIAQKGYWQQHVDYKMNIDMDVKTNRFTGEQELVYKNNSPDTLTKVFYHLYYIDTTQPDFEASICEQNFLLY